jgi:hypothetical protein
LEREKATQRLHEAGAEAIPPLETAIRQGDDLEAVTRGLGVLEQQALEADDAALREAAIAAVTRLAAAPRPLVADRSQALLATVEQTRRAQAMAHLERLGAKIRTTQALAAPAFLPVPVELSLEIGPDWQGTDDDLKRLALLTNVRYAALEGEKVTDAWLEQVAALPSLQSLTIKRAKITSAGIEKLRALKELFSLEVMYSPIDDDAAKPLGEMRQLSLLRLFGTKITKPAGDKLATELPNTKVDLRRGGFCGIGVQAHPLGCIISNVQPRSAADRAGMEVGDIILSFANEKVSNFEELTNVIAKFQPGDDVAVELFRNEKRETLKITLGEWD